MERLAGSEGIGSQRPLLLIVRQRNKGERRSGLLFSNRSGKPLSQTNVARRSLHPILEELKVEKTGFHAMRRFRTTWLRKQREPEDIIKFWLGHAKESVTDTNSKLADDGDFRKQVAETVGTGFEVPSVLRPTRPKKSKKNDLRLERKLGNLCARGGLELPTFWFVAEQGQNPSACSGVAYGPTDDALTRTTRPR